MEPMFLTHLRERLAVKGVRRVILHEPLSNLRKVIFVQYAQNTPRTEVWRGLHGAATLLADCGKICIAVSEDIEPSNADAVFWSLAYRSNPVEDVHVAPHRSAGHGPKSGPRSEDSTLLVDATLKHSAPPLALPAREFMQHARSIWEELGLAALNPQNPLARGLVEQAQAEIKAGNFTKAHELLGQARQAQIATTGVPSVAEYRSTTSSSGFPLKPCSPTFAT